MAILSLELEHEASSADAARYCPYRYVIFGLGHLTNIISYADRTNIALAIVPMRAELSLDDSAEGACLAAFFGGYATTQILGGWLTLRHGAKIVLCGAIGLCSIATLLTPLAARTPASPPSCTELLPLCCLRAPLDLGESERFSH